VRFKLAPNLDFKPCKFFPLALQFFRGPFRLKLRRSDQTICPIHDFLFKNHAFFFGGFKALHGPELLLLSESDSLGRSLLCYRAVLLDDAIATLLHLTLVGLPDLIGSGLNVGQGLVHSVVVVAAGEKEVALVRFK
jgi:hypothetical protein